MPSLEILYEDNHLLVVNKPAGIATMGAESGPTIHRMAADYLKRTYNKPGRVFVGIVSRLDTMTSGVLVLARTSKAASRLSAQFAAKSGTGVTKIYLAAVEGHLDSPQGQLMNYVRKDDAARRMRVVGESLEGAKQARLRYVAVGHQEHLSIVAIQLMTGRKHQIRVQFSELGHPVLGDRKYGSTRQFSAGVALHSWRLQIIHPTKREPISFEAETPQSWRQLHRIMPGTNELRARVAKSFDLPGDDARE